MVRDEKMSKAEEERAKSPTYQKMTKEQEELQLQLALMEQEVKLRQEYEWLEREEKAKKEFAAMQEKIKIAKEEKAKQERLIREDWEKNHKEKSHRDKPRKRFSHKDSRSDKSHRSNSEFIGPTHNPMVPSTTYSANGMKSDMCPFFRRTAACRFGDKCSREHPFCALSTIVVIPNMFTHFCFEQTLIDEYDSDINLEYEDSETFQDFLNFYDDVLPEFQAIGEVVQFKVCCNYEPHLRGNVYVQFETEGEALKAFSTFNGRWYAGKQLSLRFAEISSWKSAICGLFHKKRCPKGKGCNFLHVFRNPNNKFREADFDWKFDPQANHSGTTSRREDSPRNSRSKHNSTPESSSRRSSYSRRSPSRRSRSKDRSSSRSRRKHSRDRSYDRDDRRDRKDKHSKRKKEEKRHHKD